MQLTFRQLKIFEAVARHQNFTRAAEELFLTQPAVSMQVRQLENRFGTPLFEQIGKRIYLTEAGNDVYMYARSVIRQLEDLEAQVERIKGLKGGRLRISVASTAKYFVPALLGIFTQRHPGITISLDVTNRESLLAQLKENIVDLVVMGRPPTGLDLDAGVIVDNPLVVIAPIDHPLAGERNIPLSRLREEVFLVREQGSGTRMAMERFFAERGLQVRTGMEVASNEAIKRSVQAGLGLGLVSRDTLDQEINLKRLVILDVDGLPIMRDWYVVHREGKRLPPVAQAFKEFLLTDARKLMRPALPQAVADPAPPRKPARPRGRAV